jgi:hypothetical protein
MDTKVIKQGIGVIGVITSAFGGFLLNIAPPKDAAPGFPVGIASLILLVVFLFIQFSPQFAWTREKYIKLWSLVAVIAVVVFIVSASLYYLNFQRLIYVHTDDEMFVKGSELTNYASELKKALEEEGVPVVTDQRLMEETGNPHNSGVIEQVWTDESVKAARTRLAFLYVLVFVSIGCAILSLTALWSAPQ